MSHETPWSRFPFLKDYPVRDQGGKRELLRERVRDKGEYLVRAGEALETLIFLTEGYARVFLPMYNGNHYLFMIYRPGAVVGDVELFTAGAATCSVQCIGRCRTVSLSMRPVRAAPESHSRLLFAMGSSVARKLVQNSHSEAVHATYSLLSRVASYYLYHDDPELRAGTLTELSQWLGASYRQLLRIHRQLVESGALEKRGSAYHVRSVELLERYAADALLEQPLAL